MGSDPFAEYPKNQCILCDLSRQQKPCPVPNRQLWREFPEAKAFALKTQHSS